MYTAYAIEASNLTKYYGKLCAVDHINFNVKEGEIFGFLGPNGAGKTTTVRMLTGISIPSDGWAKIKSYDIQKQSIQAKKLMGIVPDISNVYTELSAWDNLTFTGQLYGMSKEDREKRARELLERFDLYDRRHEKLEDYSRGMRRRVCIAMALINRSSVLFLDEPTSGLDASQMCHRIAIINHGRIAVIDTPERLKRTTEGLQSVEIAFETFARTVYDDLKGLPSVSDVHKQGDKFRLYTDNPPSVLADVWEYTKNNRMKLITVNTLGPSLEDVFVTLTGIQAEPTKVRHRGLKGMRKN
jgi:ABC-2 type transport system ATP-binding protein